MPPFRYLRPLEAYGRKKTADAARTIGGKAARLAWLIRQDMPVPRGWVLDLKPFRDLVRDRLPAGHDPHSLLRLRTGTVFHDRTARARALLLSEPVDPLLTNDLELLWELVKDDAPWGLAVRSSATCEDDDLTSMAGLATTELGVRGGRGLGDALRSVWASALLPRALSYLAARGVRDIGMAVVFQVMVPAEAAGVAFTGPPEGVMDGLFQPGEMVINAAFGLGAPVVDGAASPDVVRVERSTGRVLEYLVAEKRQALVVGPGGL
ncbi:MAG TPA: PEP/pyruvate-binding domain-containing protein, partial [Polyangiaceae bacterium]